MTSRYLFLSLRSKSTEFSIRRAYSSKCSLPADVYDVVCVGGGPAGLSLLSALRSSPITSPLRIALIEGQDLTKNASLLNPDTFSNRCSSLTPASVRYLQDMGAWDFIDQSRVQPYSRMEVWDGLSNSHINFDWVETNRQSSTIAYMIENFNLTSGLHRFLAERGGCEMLSPARVSSITYGADTDTHDLSSWPKVNLDNGQSLVARLLVGADGANSLVRTFARIQSRGWDYQRMGVVATLQLSTKHDPTSKKAYQRFLPTGPAAMLPLPGNRATLVWSTTPERATVLKSVSSTDFIALVNAAFQLDSVDIDYMHSIKQGQAEELEWRLRHTEVPDFVPDEVVDVQMNSVAAFPLKFRHADAYISERVALVGDAAHTIHPLAGQGLNQGQADVVSLVQTLENAVRTGEDIGSLLSLEPYNSGRYAANNLLLSVCDKLHKLYSFDSAPIVALRSLGLSAINQLGLAKSFIMKSAAGGA